MHSRIAIYTFKPNGADIVIEQAEKGMLPIFRQHAGFRSYTVVKTGKNTAISISVWDSEGQALESVKAAGEWVKANVAQYIESVENHVGTVSFSHRAAQHTAS